MSGRRSVGDPEYLTRRIPQNPKYQHIKTRLDTGNSLTKYTEKLEEIKRRLTWAEAPSLFLFFDVASLVAEAQRRTSLSIQQSSYSFRPVHRITMSENPNGPSRIEPDYRYKKDELFKRLKVTTFAQLAIQVASLSDETLEVTNEEIQKLEDGDSATSDAELIAGTNGKGSPSEAPLNPLLFINNTGAGESYRSTLQSVISGVGELDIEKDAPKKVDPQAKDMPYPDCPFLLLDVRDRDAYDQCHIVGAYSYPIATLSRTMNPYTNSILEYKNAHGKIIILYDDDERIASQAATTMCERGFENLFMLSGGLKVLAQKIPEGLVTGSLPVSCQVVTHTVSARKKAPPKVPPTRAENKWRFTADDLQKMKYYLEEEQIPSDTASRLSRGSSGRDTKATTVRSNHSLPSTAGSAGSLTARSLSSSSLQNRPWK